MVAVVSKFTRGERMRSTAFLWSSVAALGVTLGVVGPARALDMPFEPEDDPAPPAASPAPATTQTRPAATPAPASPAPATSSTQPATTTQTQPAPSTRPTPSTAQASTSGPTETALEEDDDADVGRHNRLRLFYLELSGGYSWVKLGLLRETNLVPDVTRLDESGYTVGGGLGFFISFVTLGVQAQVARHDSFDLGTVMLDLGIRLPTKHLEPYFRFGIGYAWLFNNNIIPGMSVDVRGVAANLGFGFDYMITPLIAIGVGADATLFNVRRAGVNGAPIITSVDLSEDGDAVGVQVSALAQLSFHF